MRISSFAIALLIFSSAAMPSDEDSLRKGTTLVRVDDVKGTKMRQGMTAAVLDAPQKKVWDIITDYAHYKDFMPRFKKSDVLETRPDGLRYHGYIGMPWPISDVSYDCDVEFSKDRQSLNFTLVPGTGKGMKSFYGTWEITPFEWDANRTLARYTLFFEQDTWYPGWAVRIGTQNTIGEIIKSVKKRLKTEAKN